ncbi:type I restriction endonuclease subunit R, partial [Mameliella alba]
FSDSSDEVLKAFSQYYGKAELEAATDPNLLFDLKAKLDEAGHYDEYEIDRVVEVELDPTSVQGDLNKAIGPVAQRLLDLFSAAKKAWKQAVEAKDESAARDAKMEMERLQLFRGDMQAYQRMYAFLSQIFDYASTGIEKRAIFYRRLVPLLEFGREREEVDLSQVRMTHHKLASKGKRSLLPETDGTKLPPVTATGTGGVRDEDKIRLQEVIEKLNDLFDGDLTDDDQLQWVFGTLRAKMEESEILRGQAANNSKEQFATSPNLKDEFVNAVMDSHAANATMSKRALDSETVLDGLLAILMEHGQLWERLREREG